MKSACRGERERKCAVSGEIKVNESNGEEKLQTRQVIFLSMRKRW